MRLSFPLRTDRVSARRDRLIVQSLKNLAHLDQAELQLVDLHVDIDSTLTLIQHLFRDRSEIVLNYTTLPEVQCFCELGQPGGH